MKQNSIVTYLPWVLLTASAYFFLRRKKTLPCAGQTLFGKLTNGQSFQTCYNPNNYPGQGWIKVPSNDFGIILIPTTEAQTVGLIRVPEKPGLWIKKTVYDKLLLEYNRIKSELRGQLFKTWITTALSAKDLMGELGNNEVASEESTNPDLKSI